MHFCPKGQAICEISQQVILRWGNSKQEKFQIISFLKKVVSVYNSYTCLMNSFRFIHCFLAKQSKKFLLSHVIHIHWQLAKIKTFICENLDNVGPLRQKCIFLILFGFNDDKVKL